eukprot:TRINITY_DN10509_c0_g2_i2.p4 TRINITY_DN10509_c0_g2~~TRINITY_DN10509_c0_g2_i2.p4  ORF type:complete len:103 (+),score=1.52 TRINITY_DN10509_c0_g2_i2:330-638(+)
MSANACARLPTGGMHRTGPAAPLTDATTGVPGDATVKAQMYGPVQRAAPYMATTIGHSTAVCATADIIGMGVLVNPAPLQPTVGTDTVMGTSKRRTAPGTAG